MLHWFRRARLSRQLTVINGLFVLVPTLLLWVTMLFSLHNREVTARTQELETRCTQIAASVERTAELCNMSTQVFLNTPALTAHLAALKNGEEPDAAALIDFYRGDIASLEKIVISNPYLYQIRVYSVADGISEMMPILYSAARMQRMPWAEAYTSGEWQLDYVDQLFDTNTPVPHVMSLVTEISTAADGPVGVLEVAARMDDLIPDLFAAQANSWCALISPQGELLAGALPEQSARPLAAYTGAALDADAQPAVQRTRLGAMPVLVSTVPLKDLNCSCLIVTSLADIYRDTMSTGLLLLLAIFAVFAALCVLVGRVTQRMLRGFYQAFDGVKAFANGDLDASVTVTGEDEVSRFAAGIGDLLNKIRQLMQDNLERELLMKNSELRALQNQINAHFIYNVLEAIKMMAEIDEEYEIADALTHLGKLLRYGMKLERGGVPLAQELEYVENYLALMNLRFDYVISLRLDIPDELLTQELPKISLQPLVENAVVHGASVLEADSSILLRGRIDRENGVYTIAVVDEGRGLDAEGLARLNRQISGEERTRSSSGNGIGLKNVQDRIQMNYGKQYGLSVFSQPGAGTTVTVRLPYREKADDLQKGSSE